MSRRGRASLVSFVLAPLLAAGLFIAFAFATSRIVVSTVLALLVAGLVAALGSVRAGYGPDEPRKVAGWTAGALVASFVAIVVALVVTIVVILETCDNCFE